MGHEHSAKAADAFQRLYVAHVDRVLGYALRRVDRPEDAADVVAETFLVAWRRLGDVPSGDATRPWLYAVARRTLANQRRGTLRRTHLGDRLRDELSTVVPDHAAEVAGRVDVEALLATLAPADREVLELSAWEGLQPREIARVVGASALAVRTRLSRARRRLRVAAADETSNDSGRAGHPSVDSRTPHPLLTSEESR